MKKHKLNYNVTVIPRASKTGDVKTYLTDDEKALFKAYAKHSGISMNIIIRDYIISLIKERDICDRDYLKCKHCDDRKHCYKIKRKE